MNQTVTNIRTEESDAQPTAGPWRVTEIGSVWSARNGLVAVVYPVATTYRDEMLANARLIAAAPDLLSALQALLDVCARDACPLCDRARQVMAKAKGEA